MCRLGRVEESPNRRRARSTSSSEPISATFCFTGRSPTRSRSRAANTSSMPVSWPSSARVTVASGFSALTCWGCPAAPPGLPTAGVPGGLRAAAAPGGLAAADHPGGLPPGGRRVRLAPEPVTWRALAPARRDQRRVFPAQARVVRRQGPVVGVDAPRGEVIRVGLTPGVPAGRGQRPEEDQGEGNGREHEVAQPQPGKQQANNEDEQEQAKSGIAQSDGPHVKSEGSQARSRWSITSQRDLPIETTNAGARIPAASPPPSVDPLVDRGGPCS